MAQNKLHFDIKCTHSITEDGWQNITARVGMAHFGWYTTGKAINGVSFNLQVQHGPVLVGVWANTYTCIYIYSHNNLCAEIELVLTNTVRCYPQTVKYLHTKLSDRLGPGSFIFCRGPSIFRLYSWYFGTKKNIKLYLFLSYM